MTADGLTADGLTVDRMTADGRIRSRVAESG